MGKVPKPNIQWRGAHPNNFTVGRPGGGLDGRNSNHHVVGSAESAVLVFNQANRGASSHLIITDRADIQAWQCVDFGNTAWCDGNWESNLRTISMEHHGDWRFGYVNDQVIENSARVVAWLRDQGLVNRPIRHRDVKSSTVCPGDLPVERIWDRATQIINEYNNVDNRPQWLKDRQAASGTVYAQKPDLYLRNLHDPSQPFDGRRFVQNQSFEIGSKTVVGGKTYYITRSSTDTNAAAGLAEDEVASQPYVPASPWVAMDNPRSLRAKETLFVINLDTNQPTGSPVTAGTDISLVEKKDQNGTTYYRSKWGRDNGKNWGIDSKSLMELPAAPPAVEPPVITPPVTTTPTWADAVIDDPNRTLYVLRATQLIDLENGRPATDKNGKEIWYQAGDIIEDVSAHTIINEITYELTEYSFQQVEADKWQNANGIKSSDLTTDPSATPIGTPANPGKPEEPTDPVEPMPDVPTPEQPGSGNSNNNGGTSVSNTITSLIRTWVPIAVGAVIAWLLSQGITLDENAANGLVVFLTALLQAVYYLGARLLEKVNPTLGGLLLGSTAKPTYVEPRK